MNDRSQPRFSHSSARFDLNAALFVVTYAIWQPLTFADLPHRRSIFGTSITGISSSWDEDHGDEIDGGSYE